jgi:hypothetical protein
VRPLRTFAGHSPAFRLDMPGTTQTSPTAAPRRQVHPSRPHPAVWPGALLALGFLLAGCGGGSGSAAITLPPPPPVISVTISPLSGTILLGNSEPFAATVTNTSNTGVTWSVNGVAGGTAATGTISASGTYTAPADLPASPVVQITATSLADASASATAQITITSDIAVAISPPAASVELGAVQAFHASITSNGHPDPTVRWSVSGAACPASCGSVDLNGNYTAPGILPSPTSATLTAQSVADPSKQASAQITITSTFILQISAPATIAAGASATLVATMTPVPGSNPSAVLSWALSGPGCSSTACGTLTVVSAQGSSGSAVQATATYTAPNTAPNPDTVTVTVTPQANPAQKTQAILTVQPGVNVSLSPSSYTLAINHRVTLTAQVFGSANTGVNWSVAGVAGGNAAAGQICVVGSNPCQGVPSGSALQVDYIAPGALPQPNPVSVTAISIANSAQAASTQITVISHVVVSVQPANVTLAPLSVEGFTASVLGTTNQSVTWQIEGSACSPSGVCGTIDANGNYTAPGAAPSPDSLQVVATSADDTTQSGSANVSISTGANILTLLPASVYVGAADGFTLLVEGSGFAPSSPGPGSTLLIAGTARTTTCSTANACTAPVTPADVSATGNVSVQIQNPDGSESNAVSLVVAPANASNAVITLTSAAPAATRQNIVVVDPTTAGVSAEGNDVDLNVAALGMYATASNTCSLAGNPLPLVRPASGSATFSVCMFSESGLDTSMAYSLTGPGDITVLAAEPAGLGIVYVTLQVPATAQPGARTLFIQNPNLDQAGSSGSLVIQ